MKKNTYVRDTCAVLSLVAVAVGCGMERLSLGILVPGLIVFVCLAWSHMRE